MGSESGTHLRETLVHTLLGRTLSPYRWKQDRYGLKRPRVRFQLHVFVGKVDMRGHVLSSWIPK